MTKNIEKVLDCSKLIPPDSALRVMLHVSCYHFTSNQDRLYVWGAACFLNMVQLFPNCAMEPRSIRHEEPTR